jgi:hypothetical protein
MRSTWFIHDRFNDNHIKALTSYNDPGTIHQSSVRRVAKCQVNTCQMKTNVFWNIAPCSVADVSEVLAASVTSEMSVNFSHKTGIFD